MWIKRHDIEGEKGGREGWMKTKANENKSTKKKNVGLNNCPSY